MSPNGHTPVHRWLAGSSPDELSICGASVTIDAVSHDAGAYLYAVAIFEAHAATLGERALAPFAQVADVHDLIEAGRGRASDEGAQVVCVRETDAVCFFNIVRRVTPHLPLEANIVPVGFFARHLFRQLARNSRGEVELHLDLGERFITPVLADLAAFDLGPSVSILELSEAWDFDANAMRVDPIALGELLPSLTHLTTEWWLWDLISAEPLHTLERLIFDGSYQVPNNLPSPEDVVTSVARRCPKLRKLTLGCPLSKEVLGALGKYRLAQRLELIELRGAMGNKPRLFYEALLQAESVLAEVNRLRIYPPGRASLRNALAQWPSIEFIE